MGLFGGILHALGKVVGGAAKAVASTATGGASDKFLSLIKSKGQSKLLAAAGMTESPKARTLQTQTMVLKRDPRGYARTFEGGDDQNIGRVALRIAAKKGAAAEQAMLQKESLRLAGVPGDYSSEKKKGGGKPRVVAARMLDFRAMSRAWVAANKPVTWQQWIKDFPQYTTAGKLTKVVR